MAPEMPNLIAFSVLAALAVLAALGVILSQSAIRSALCLVGNFLILAVLYFTLQSQILGILQVVVYTGAIMVLFLFVIMLLATGGEKSLFEKRDPKRFAAAITGIVLAVIIGVLVYLPMASIKSPAQVPLSPGNQVQTQYGTAEALGAQLFTQYGYPFEAASLLLMVGIVGSIMLAKRKVR